jgi:Domain of unknown function (DUF4190)
MSDASQGPGWWMASDGKWYPPSAPPVATRPPVPVYGYASLAQSTNGLAVASFVLSLLWIGGLGSLLAVIFAISARRSIMRSGGREGGDGLAIAGLVIGILGILGSVWFYTTLATLDHGVREVLQQAATPHVGALGHTFNVSSADNGSASTTVTVYSVSYPVDDSRGQPDPMAGKEYAVADIQVCAGSSGSQSGPDGSFFNLLFQDGQSAGLASTPYPKQPDLGGFNSIPANGCVRGFLTFEIASGTTPTEAQYWPDPFHNYEWTLQIPKEVAEGTVTRGRP